MSVVPWFLYCRCNILHKSLTLTVLKDKLITRIWFCFLENEFLLLHCMLVNLVDVCHFDRTLLQVFTSNLKLKLTIGSSAFVDKCLVQFSLIFSVFMYVFAIFFQDDQELFQNLIIQRNPKVDEMRILIDFDLYFYLNIICYDFNLI